MSKIIILTDCHIGSLESNYRDVNRFLRQLSCDRLVLAGDFWDLWDFDTEYLQKRYSDTVILLKRLRLNGIQVEMILGNHDENYLDNPVVPVGLIPVVNGTEITTPSGRRIAIIHGQHYDPLFSYFYCVSRSLAYVNNWARRIFGLSNKTFKKKSCTDLTGRKYSDMVRRTHDKAIQAYRNYQYDGLIIGHTHSPCHLTRDGFEFVNAGDWKFHNTYVVIEGDEIQLRSFDKTIYMPRK